MHDGGRVPGADFIRERALQALRQGDFTLAERLLERGEVSLVEMVENLRVYQVELEIQNIELRQAQDLVERSMRRFTDLFVSLPLAILVVDRAGLILDANNQAQDLFGLRNRHLRQHFLRRLVRQEDHPALGHAIVVAHEHGQAKVPDVSFQAAGGDWRRGELHIARLSEAAEQGTQFVCAFLDSTDSLRQQGELGVMAQRMREEEARYRILADYSPDWEYWVSPDGSYAYVSPACEATSGHAAAEFLADADLLPRLLHPEDQATWLAHIAQRRQFVQAHDVVHMRIVRPDGEVRWIEHQCQAVHDPEGNYLGQRGVNRDITQRKLAEQEVARLNRLYTTLARCNRAMATEQGESAMLESVCRIVVEEGGLDACVVSLFGGAGHDLIHVAQAGLDDARLAMMPDTIVMPGQTEWHAHDDGQDAWRAWLRQTGLGASFHHVLHERGNPQGLISYLSAAPEAFGGEFDQLLRELAADLSRALAGYAHRRGELDQAHRLARREAQLNAMLMTAPMGMAHLVGRTFAMINPAFCAMLGYASSELLGQGTLPIYADEAEYDRVGQQVYTRLLDQDACEVEARLLRKDGVVIRALLRFGVLDKADPSRGVVCIAQLLS